MVTASVTGTSVIELAVFELAFVMLTVSLSDTPRFFRS